MDAAVEVLSLNYSLSVVRVPPPDGRPVPYALGYVDLLAEGLRIFTRFVGDPETLSIGMQVEMVKVMDRRKGGDDREYAFIPV